MFDGSWNCWTIPECSFITVMVTIVVKPLEIAIIHHLRINAKLLNNKL